MAAAAAAAPEEPAGSAESVVAGRTPVPSASPGSPQQPAEPGLWERIGAEIEAEKPSFPEGCKAKQEVVSTASLEHGFYGFNAQHLHSLPRVPGIPHQPCSQVKPEEVDPQTCSPKEYLEKFVFPTLLPGMESLLHQAEKEKCFERKRTKFIACDYLTQWLFNQNPKRAGEPFTEFFSIPFVEQWLKDHPRPPIPLSLLLSEEQAVLIIQSFWRGYLVRCHPEIQELRHWQKKLREEKHIRQRIQMFWAKQEKKLHCSMEDDD
ncbi:IQ domain-containing protein K [Sorex fumeus]|uniref:IQ domain-containing protein K n=1 Tax=Sorex fumeus TaxID=62283 RepID=UPI0024AE6E88|nr:IQ domain-containing protein K [Sorex fumeus]